MGVDIVKRHEFIETSFVYYALAISIFFTETQTNHAFLEDIITYYTISTDEFDGHQFVHSNAIFDRAVIWLSEKGMLSELKDRFGPTVYTVSPDFSHKFDELVKSASTDSPLYKFRVLKDGESWLKSALNNLNSQFYRVVDEHEEEGTVDDEWAPIPLDRTDPKLEEVISRLEEVAEQIRGENGYSASHPKERDYVLEGLTTGTNGLKTDATTSVPYIRKYILDPLSIVMKRFKGAALEVSSATLKQLIIDFVRQHTPSLIDALLRWFQS